LEIKQTHKNMKYAIVAVADYATASMNDGKSITV
jgi:hypothetical protein